MQTQETRYFLVDGIRGFAVVNMVLFHFLYDVFIIYEKNPLWYHLPRVYFWQQMICWIFIFISGFVWTWAVDRNLWRGILLNVYGLLLSFFTLTVIPTETIWFGILNFIGCAVLFLFPLQKILKKVSPIWGIMGCFFLFFLSRQIQYGYLGIGDFMQMQVPKFFYSIKVLTPFGFPFPGFYSSDYFPIFPWIFLYLCGYFFYKIFIRYPLWKKIACCKIPFLSAIGKRSIWIYLFHQPVCILLCSVLLK